MVCVCFCGEIEGDVERLRGISMTTTVFVFVERLRGISMTTTVTSSTEMSL
jgi:hypothetical protein